MLVWFRASMFFDVRVHVLCLFCEYVGRVLILTLMHIIVLMLIISLIFMLMLMLTFMLMLLYYFCCASFCVSSVLL